MLTAIVEVLVTIPLIFGQTLDSLSQSFQRIAQLDLALVDLVGLVSKGTNLVDVILEFSKDTLHVDDVVLQLKVEGENLLFGRHERVDLASDGAFEEM